MIHGFLELHMHRLQGAQAPQRARTGLAAMPFATKSAKRRRPLFPYEPLKVYEVMKRANVVNEEACQSLLLKMRDEGLVKFDIHKGRWHIG